MQSTQRLYHPLSPAIGVAAIAVAGLAARAVMDVRPTAWAWWLLIGLASGYALSGSV